MSRRILGIVCLLLAAVAPVPLLPRQTAAIDCFSFTSQAQAQEVLNALPNDPYWLDHADQNGVACDAVTGATGLLATAEANRPHRKKPPRNPPNQPSADAIANPATIVNATIHYGDVFVVYHEQGSAHEVFVVLVGIAVPELQGAQYRPGFQGPECYYQEALQDLNRLLPQGATTYVDSQLLEGANDTGYVWIKEGKSSKYVLVNAALVSDGAAVAGDTPQDINKENRLPAMVEYENVIEKAQKDAIKRKAGLWGACG